MDWSAILSIILKAVGSIGATIIITLATTLFTKLKNKLNEAKLYAFVKHSVQAAEQLYPNNGSKTGKQKYEYVVKQVLAKYPKMVENEYLKNLIEGAVYTVSEQVKQIQDVKSETENKTLTSF